MTERTDFSAARHPQDDWLDQIPGKHRVYFDAVSPNGAAEAITFASNYTAANKSGYGLEATDLALVIGLRHFATLFAFNDAMWAKYGALWAPYIEFKDPATGASPVRNVWNAKGLPGRQPNRGVTIEDAAARGIRFAVCDMASHAFARMTAQSTNGNADAIYAELQANILGGGRLVPAGIVALSRAQERGYTFSYIG